MVQNDAQNNALVSIILSIIAGLEPENSAGGSFEGNVDLFPTAAI